MHGAQCADCATRMPEAAPACILRKGAGAAARGGHFEVQEGHFGQVLGLGACHRLGRKVRFLDQARQQVGHHSLEEVKGWLSNQGQGSPELIGSLLKGVQRDDFHYSRLVAVGLLSLLQSAQGADALDPQALRSAAHEIGESMGLIKDRVDKDLSLYAGNMEKMSQAVELMEETLAAERRRRERAAEGSAT